MNLKEFKDELAIDVKADAMTNLISDREQFLTYASDILVEFGEMTSFDYSFFDRQIKNKKILVDGYSYEGMQKELILVVSQYDSFQSELNLTKTDVDKLAKHALNFLSFREMIREESEESASIWDLSDKLHYLWKNIELIKIIVLTDRSVSKLIKKIDANEFEGRKVSFSVWGIERLHEVAESKNSRENTEISFKDYGIDGIEAIHATFGDEIDYQAFMAVINGDVLADIYNDYGAALLEGNVRSFLMNRGAVNRGIRGTILEQPAMFFAYNNGIAATASSIETETINGKLLIKQINNLQIVNGGQTTASIFNVKHVEKRGNLKLINVPMKISVIDEEEKADQLIPKIARYANNQNRVSASDFFSNHKFHRSMETISRRLLAPAVDGNQFGTYWFYERARGQYNQAMMKMTQSQKKAYKLKNPKSQIITKTDLAKYFYSRNQRPDFVSLGAQRNFMKFAETVTKQWLKDENQFNRQFYIEMVIVGLIFKHLEKLVSHSDWYQNAFRANIVTYSISYLFYLIDEQYSDKTLNFEEIWNAQEVPAYLHFEFGALTYKIFLELTREEYGRTRNITEWAKKPEAWEATKRNIKHKFAQETVNSLMDKARYLRNKETEIGEYKKNKVILTQSDVVNKGASFWKKVHEFGLKNKAITSIENDILNIASIMSGSKIPSEKQSLILMKLLEKLENEGFQV